ncbi:hypothetical protein ACWCQQ_51045, partial [Streptomyces sp. NPDC002143]
MAGTAASVWLHPLLLEAATGGFWRVPGPDGLKGAGPGFELVEGGMPMGCYSLALKAVSRSA